MAERGLVRAPDGAAAVMFERDGRLSLFPLNGGPARAIPGVEAGDEAVRFTADGRALFLTRHELPLRIFRLRALSAANVTMAIVSEVLLTRAPKIRTAPWGRPGTLSVRSLDPKMIAMMPSSKPGKSCA